MDDEMGGRRVSEPEAAHRRPQPIERSRGFSAPFAGAVTPVAQEPAAEGGVSRHEQA
ncbi:MAG TPA: hypothetical protein VF792_02030 [Ktedonobacterales bacterium]